MQLDLEIAVTLLSAVVTVGTVIALDRRRSREEGAKDQQFSDMRVQVAKHEKDIYALKNRCMSWADHEVDADKCRAAILGRVDDVSARQDSMDASREKAREDDRKWKEADQNWKTSILLYLGKIASKLDIPQINHHDI